MISIVRGPEPQEVIDVREEHLSRASLDSPLEGPSDVKGYGIARAGLYQRQFSKCAYCENWVQEESQPVEHIRPKGRPSRIDWRELSRPRRRDIASEDGARDARADEARFARGLPPTAFDRVRWPDPDKQANAGPGYWWLAWSWENLVFGCVSCNGASRKGTRFPLTRGSPVLGLHEQPPGREQALLLDPTDQLINPMDVLRFRWDGKHWRPFPINDDARAAWTIAVLGLDGPSLLGLYRSKVKTLTQMARAFKTRLDEQAPTPSILAEWITLHGSALATGESFLALTHDWLASTFAAEIARHGLILERPSLHHVAASGDAARHLPLPRRVELDGLPERLQSRVRVMRHHQAPNEELRVLLVDICRERPSTTDALVSLLGPARALTAHLDALDGKGLVRDVATGCWSPGS